VYTTIISLQNKSKAMVAAEATVQKTMEETMKEESKLERKHRLLATERERLQKIEVEKMQKRSEEKARKEKEMEDSPAEESIEDNPFEEADEAVKAADVDSAEVSPKSSCIVSWLYDTFISHVCSYAVTSHIFLSPSIHFLFIHRPTCLILLPS